MCNSDIWRKKKTKNEIDFTSTVIGVFRDGRKKAANSFGASAENIFLFSRSSLISNDPILYRRLQLSFGRKTKMLFQQKRSIHWWAKVHKEMAFSISLYFLFEKLIFGFRSFRSNRQTAIEQTHCTPNQSQLFVNGPFVGVW